MSAFRTRKSLKSLASATLIGAALALATTAPAETETGAEPMASQLDYPAAKSETEAVMPPPSSSTEDRNLQNWKRKKRRRRVASVDYSSNGYEELEVSRSPRRRKGDFEARLSSLAGFSMLTGTDQEPNYTNLALNANADARFYKYVGAELDLHGDLLGGTFTDSTGPEETRKRRGGSFFLKGQYRFPAGSVRFVPKVGVGFGVDQAVIGYSVPATGEQTTLQVTTRGLAGMLGADFEPSRDVVFFFDIAFSVGGTGTWSLDSASADEEYDGSFSRFRLGGMYRFERNWAVGGTLARRGMSLSSPDGAVPDVGSDLSQFQFMGMLVYEIW